VNLVITTWSVLYLIPPSYLESNPTWKQKAIAAFKQGSLNVMETHPIGKFIVGAIKGWQEP
jgi:hypothetical protein